MYPQFRGVFSFFSIVIVAAGVSGCHHNGEPWDAGDGVTDAGATTMQSPTLDFSITPYDIAVAPCVPTTCAAQGANCGPISDGCSGILQCGSTCPANQSCGGGGTPSVCGTPCVPKTCADQKLNCGPAGDGCGAQLDCGTCTNGDTCGGGGTPSVCGSSSVCTPTTCAQLGYNCGPAGDGCGHTLDCGTCTNGDICGGGGSASVCGKAPCTPTTCSAVGPKTCGPIGDGCGGSIQCGGCSAPATCGGSVSGQCSVPTSCTGLCLQQTACSTPNTTTTVSGVVYAPNGVDPLPNVLVYIPNAPVAAFAPGVACEQCTDSVSGSPLVSVATDTEGKFTLSNVPIGANIPLVMQTGRWRRQVTIANVASCVNTPLAGTLTRLPRNQSEGDIPHMAFVTGAVDALECVIRKIGVDDAEFTSGTGTGRIHLYVGDGSTAAIKNLGGAAAAGSTSESTLTGSASTIDQYDMVLFPCKGDQYLRPTTEQQNVIAYANKGGRIFATHFSYTWLFNDAPFSMTAAWDVERHPSPADQIGTIDQSFPKGQALAEWLQYVGATTTQGQIPLTYLRADLDSLVSPSQQWISVDDINLGVVPMHYTFNTPVAAAASSQCGRVLFDDFHVENTSAAEANDKTFPAECLTGAMSAQEKLLEFMIFDLGSCVTPDVPVCTKTTCAAQNIQCGPAGDGCGGSLDCGSCTLPETCGGGGMPSVCGAPSCTQTTCSAQGIQCGPAGNGCGGSLDCGPCPPGQTCGGGGMPGICGAGTCKPTTCAKQGIDCGPAGNGCGGSLDCGTCMAPQTCGGGGSPGQCGSLCTPATCASLGFDCGPAGDGCGGQLDCGMCGLPQTCGGGGKGNVCGGAVIL